MYSMLPNDGECDMATRGPNILPAGLCTVAARKGEKRYRLCLNGALFGNRFVQLSHILQLSLSSTWSLFRHPFEIKHLPVSKIEAARFRRIGRRFSWVLPSKRVMGIPISKVYSSGFISLSCVKYPDHFPIKRLHHLKLVGGYSCTLKSYGGSIFQNGIGSVFFSAFLYKYLKGSPKTFKVLLPLSAPWGRLFSPRITIIPR